MENAPEDRGGRGLLARRVRTRGSLPLRPGGKTRRSLEAVVRVAESPPRGEADFSSSRRHRHLRSRRSVHHRRIRPGRADVLRPRERDARVRVSSQRDRGRQGEGGILQEIPAEFHERRIPKEGRTRERLRGHHVRTGRKLEKVGGERPLAPRSPSPEALPRPTEKLVRRTGD